MCPFAFFFFFSKHILSNKFARKVVVSTLCMLLQRAQWTVVSAAVHSLRDLKLLEAARVEAPGQSSGVRLPGMDS